MFGGLKRFWNWNASMINTQKTPGLGIFLNCGHRANSYATDGDGKTTCIECYHKRYSYAKEK